MPEKLRAASVKAFMCLSVPDIFLSACPQTTVPGSAQLVAESLDADDVIPAAVEGETPAGLLGRARLGFRARRLLLLRSRRCLRCGIVPPAPALT